MSQLWTIADSNTGQVLYAAFTTPSAGSHPRYHGWDWDAGSQRATRIAKAPDLLNEVWDGDKWVPDVASMKARALLAVDAEAEGIRAMFLTAGSGQAMTYAKKEAEARAFLADNFAATPFLDAEAPARGMTLPALAAEVVALADAWCAVGSAIEGLRMGAKTAIAAAATPDEVAAAAVVDWSAVMAANG